MALPSYLAARHKFPDRKGTILDVPGVQGGIWMVDPNGKVLAKGFSLKLVGSRMTQPDPSKAPFEVATVKVTKPTADGGRATYTVTQPVQRIMESFTDVLREAVGETAEFVTEDPFDALLLLTLAASSKETEHLAPTHTQMQFVESGCWFYASDAEIGKRGLELACNAAVEVAREIKTDSGEVLYRLRIPRGTDGKFFDYCTVSREDLLSGNFHFSERLVSIHNAPKAAISILNRWEGLSEGDKAAQVRDEWTQPDREAKAKRDSQFGFNGWRP